MDLNPIMSHPRANSRQILIGNETDANIRHVLIPVTVGTCGPESSLQHLTL